jgi:uncharacterized protein
MIFSGFIFGLISSLHCIAMCGPIAMMLPVDHKNQSKKVIQILLYQLGRITSYSFLGFIFGLLGRGLFIAGFQQRLSILIGVLIILIILIPEKVFANYNFSKPIFSLISLVKSKLGAQFKSKTYKSIYFIGILNGFLPCGLVYVALFGAMAMQNVSLSMFYMILYGLGTIPMMTLVIYISNFISFSNRIKLQKMIPVVGIFIGFLFVLRGLGLDIPFVSPSNLNLLIQNTPHCQ